MGNLERCRHLCLLLTTARTCGDLGCDAALRCKFDNRFPIKVNSDQAPDNKAYPLPAIVIPVTASSTRIRSNRSDHQTTAPPVPASRSFQSDPTHHPAEMKAFQNPILCRKSAGGGGGRVLAVHGCRGKSSPILCRFPRARVAFSRTPGLSLEEDSFLCSACLRGCDRSLRPQRALLLSKRDQAARLISAVRLTEVASRLKVVLFLSGFHQCRACARSAGSWPRCRR